MTAGIIDAAGIISGCSAARVEYTGPVGLEGGIASLFGLAISVVRAAARGSVGTSVRGATRLAGLRHSRGNVNGAVKTDQASGGQDNGATAIRAFSAIASRTGGTTITTRATLTALATQPAVVTVGAMESATGSGLRAQHGPRATASSTPAATSGSTPAAATARAAATATASAMTSRKGQVIGRDLE